MTAFDYIDAINHTKKNIIEDEATEKAYVPFLTNRGLSYFPDTVFYANEMNCNPHLDKKLQFDYLINSIRKAKRYSKWAKRNKGDNDIELVQEYYGYSYEKAKMALTILSEDQLETIRKRLEKGGL